MKSGEAEIEIQQINPIGDHTQETSLLITLSGRLDSISLAKIWPFTMDHLKRSKPRRLVVEAADLKYCDGAGIAYLQELEKRLGHKAEYRSLSPEIGELANFLGELEPAAPEEKKEKQGFVELQGALVRTIFADLYDEVAFLGSLSKSCIGKLPRIAAYRWGEVWRISYEVGFMAVPIILLIGGLIGMIMAFQAAVPMKQFGAEIFVADLLGLSMVRELGPFMAAIILAGRSGSAFAAELGTMEVSDENNALRTMGLNPIDFLVIPRFIAAMLMLPILSIFCTLASLVGGAVVCLSLGIPLVIYFQRIVEVLTVAGYLAGICKAAVFGAIVAGVGCLRGLQTRGGPSGVGSSTTRSVVTGIILIVIADAIFAVVLFALDL